MGDITLPVSKLLLDELNPRHRAVTTQDAALAEVIRRAPTKLLNLARDIAAEGLSPIERLIVMKNEDGKKYIVLEGNRRLVALRLLARPERCPDVHLRAKFGTIADLAAQQTMSARCYEVESRDEARPLLARRHSGEMDGVGVVRWSAMQRTRNSTSPGHQERVALATLDWLDGKSSAGANKQLADLLDDVAEGKFTTFGRLVGDPDFRAYCGFDIKGDVFTAIDNSENVVLRLSLVLEDFRRDRPLTVTELKLKKDREKYIDELRERIAGADESDNESDDEEEQVDDEPSAGDGSIDDDSGGDDSAEGDGGDPEPEAKPEPQPKPQPMKLFVGASLNNCSLRLRNILHEVQVIPLNKYPNSAAALIRMVIELAVMEAHSVCGWSAPPEKDTNLRAFVSNAIRELDPTMRAARYLDLRQQIHKKDSIINTVTLNAFLHNPDYSPSAPVMRSISDTYSLLLTDLNRAIGEAKDAKA